MPKVVVTAQVEDSVKWEAGFRTHADLFRNVLAVTAPVYFAMKRRERNRGLLRNRQPRDVHEGDGKPCDRRGHGSGWRQTGNGQGVCLGQRVQGLVDAGSTERSAAH